MKINHDIPLDLCQLGKGVVQGNVKMNPTGTSDGTMKDSAVGGEDESTAASCVVRPIRTIFISCQIRQPGEIKRVDLSHS